MPFSCRIDLPISTRRFFKGSLATIALALPFAASAQSQYGHVRSEFPTGYAGPWQLFSTASGLDLSVYADFTACRQAAVTGPDMACKPVTPPDNDAPLPPVVQPPMTTMPMMNAAFAIDASALPKGSSGVGYDRLQPTSEVAPPSDIGAFRIPCAFSHMAFDDPIVFPGRPGASHLHTFFGNTGTNAMSTAESIRGSGNSTCLGGTINRTAYWVPTMIDTATGKPIVPDAAIFYYKQGYVLSPSSIIHALPQGLRMVAGDPTNNKAGASAVGFKCIGGPNDSNDQYGSAIPNCDAGASVVSTVSFPQCWDGVNLDSPDHKSHVHYPVQDQNPPFLWSCPATHPVAIPQITFNIYYTVQTKDAAKAWRLASDTYDRSLPGGYSSHGDWFNGWENAISDAWAAGCVQASRDCHAHLLGDGRMMY